MFDYTPRNQLDSIKRLVPGTPPTQLYALGLGFVLWLTSG